MSQSSTTSHGRSVGGRSRFLMMSFGIVLFVIGFLFTLAAIPGRDSSGTTAASNEVGSGSNTSGTAPQLYLILGICISFAGVVLATVGPAVRLVRANPGK